MINLSSINCPYCIFWQSFQIFSRKTETSGKWSHFLLLGVSNITLMLIFMKSKKLHYLQTEKKVVNPKDVSGERIKFCPDSDKPLPIFQILKRTNWFKIGSYLRFSTLFGFINFDLVLFPFCLVWNFFLSQKILNYFFHF